MKYNILYLLLPVFVLAAFTRPAQPAAFTGADQPAMFTGAVQPVMFSRAAQPASAPTLRASVPVLRASVPALRASVPAQRAQAPALRASVPALRASVPALRASVPALRASVPALMTCRNVSIQLYSKTPLENINAEALDGGSVLNESTGEIAFQVKIRSFVFPHALMQEHFNENYLESDKFPLATFKGVIVDKPDYAADGDYTVTVNGQLTMHGVMVVRSISGKLGIHQGIVSLTSVFSVPCKDHQIEIPTIVTAKIAETITVTVKAVYTAVKTNSH